MSIQNHHLHLLAYLLYKLNLIHPKLQLLYFPLNHQTPSSPAPHILHQLLQKLKIKERVIEEQKKNKKKKTQVFIKKIG